MPATPQKTGKIAPLFTRAALAAALGAAVTLPAAAPAAAAGPAVKAQQNTVAGEFAHAAKKSNKQRRARKRGTTATQTAVFSRPRATLVMDFETGVILSQDNAGELRHPASLTKVMTLLLVFEAMRDGRLQAGQDLTVSAHAASMVPVKLGLKAGATIKLEDAIRLVATKSTNDIAVVLAEAVAGTESQFADLMTQKARALGMNDTVFRNASGLPDRAQVTTAIDMALMTRHLILDYENEYETYFGLRSVRYKGQTYTATNRLLGRYQGMDGVKTGYINDSGFNLIASVERKGRRLIGVIFGGASARSRDNEMVRLLDRGFRTPVPAPVPIPTPRPDYQPPANDNSPAQNAPDGLTPIRWSYGYALRPPGMT